MPSQLPRVLWAVCLTIMLTACSSSAPRGSTSTFVGGDTASSTSTSAAGGGAALVPPQLGDFDLDMVVVGDRLLLLAIADSPALREQGLMGVTDLGDLDGMLFYWRHEASGGFWMKDTVIPLDIVWFDEGGTFVGRASMVPCTTSDCPIYSPGDGIDFRYAIEAPPGTLDWVDASTTITHSD